MTRLRIYLALFLAFALVGSISACDGDTSEESKRVEELKKENADLQKQLKAASGIAKLTRPAPKRLPDGSYTRLFVVPAMGVDADDLSQALKVSPLAARRLQRRNMVVLRSTLKGDPTIHRIQVDKVAKKDGVKTVYPAVDLSMPAVVAGRFGDIDFAADVSVIGISPDFAKYLAGETEPAFGSKPTAESPHAKVIITRRLYDYLIDSAAIVSGNTSLQTLKFQYVFVGIKLESRAGTFRLIVGRSRVAMREADKTQTVTFEIVGITDRLTAHAILLPEKTVRDLRQAFEPSTD